MTVAMRIISLVAAAVLVLVVISVERVVGLPFLSFCAAFMLLARMPMPEKAVLMTVSMMLLQAGFLLPVWLSGVLLVSGLIFLQIMKQRAKLQAIRHVVIGLVVIGVVMYWQRVSLDLFSVGYLVMAALLIGWLSGTVVHTFGVHREITIR